MCRSPSKNQNFAMIVALLFASTFLVTVDAIADQNGEVAILKTACNDNEGLKKIYRDWKNKGRPIVAECYDGTKWRLFNGKVVPYAKKEAP